MKRASLALLLSLPLLGGCSSDGSSNYSQIWQVIRNSVSGSFGNRKVTRDQAASIPYASMSWHLKGDNQNIIVLATDSGGRRLWTAAAHSVLVTQEGRLVRSVGLGHDLGSLTPRGGDSSKHPVINRWEYSDFIVYFEHDHVIHSVLNTPAGNNTHPASAN